MEFMRENIFFAERFAFFFRENEKSLFWLWHYFETRDRQNAIWGFRTGFFPPIFCGTDPESAKSGAGSGPVPVSSKMPKL
jgi:hypothetical protein